MKTVGQWCAAIGGCVDANGRWHFKRSAAAAEAALADTSTLSEFDRFASPPSSSSSSSDGHCHTDQRAQPCYAWRPCQHHRYRQHHYYHYRLFPLLLLQQLKIYRHLQLLPQQHRQPQRLSSLHHLLVPGADAAAYAVTTHRHTVPGGLSSWYY